MNSTSRQSVLAIIPARLASTRFPGKVLALLAGKPLVMHVYDRTSKAALVTETVIATDDSEVLQALEPFDANVVMTRRDHPTGTDRAAEVAENSDASIIVNVQGDEVMIDPDTIDATVRALFDNPDVPMSTARHRITDPAEINDPNAVKVVCDKRGRALYFSRNPIPCVRDSEDMDRAEYWKHIGLYAYRREFLMEYAKMAPTPLEKLEQLEQLRALENGHDIAVIDTEYRSVSVDTPEDLERVTRILEVEVAN